MFKIWCWSVKGFSVGGPSKIALSHWKLASPIQHCFALTCMHVKMAQVPVSCFMFRHLYSQDATEMALGTRRKVTGEIFDFALALQCKMLWQKEIPDPLSKCLNMTMSLRKCNTTFHWHCPCRKIRGSKAWRSSPRFKVGRDASPQMAMKFRN
jgi:hypothetical protein